MFKAPRLYFGLGREQSLALGEIGQRLGLTRERVRQIKEFTMHFDREKLTAIEQFLDAKWPTPRTCPVCRENPDHWRISEMPVLLPLLTGRVDISLQDFARAVESLAVAPAVALTCSNCGHILLFSASEMGITPVEPRAGKGRLRSSISSE